MLKNTILICLIVLAGKIFAQSGPEDINDKDYTANRYTDTTINGWKVRVNTRLIEDHRLITTKAEDILQTELQAIEKRLPTQVMPYLNETPIWLEFNTPDNQPIQYHVSAKWLAMNFYDTKKESSIEIVVPDYASMPHDSLPLLRMFSYAYMHGVLGTQNKEIEDVYKNAKDKKIYLTTVDGEQIFPFKSRTDYFVSISTAYFGDVAYAPYNRKKLKEMDPKGYELVEKLWKVKE
jgi:hypothetical protein